MRLFANFFELSLRFIVIVKIKRGNKNFIIVRFLYQESSSLYYKNRKNKIEEEIKNI